VSTDFWERQRIARSTTLRLVVLFALGVISIVVVVDAVVLAVVHRGPTGTIVGWLIAATLITVLIIGGGTAARMASLRAGGSAVAQSAGATAVDPSTTDPQLRRLVNVVEEMSIASGVPMPRLYVLDSEPGINAFAAGYTPADAAICVTGGALRTLNRDELQGVIGHEFSHVLNGDMRLNIRLIGLLSGILLLGLVGLRFLQFGGGSRRDSRNGNPLLVLAIAMVVLGFVGKFFAGLIQAAVSRQREWLADASSVQFTRQPAGLVGALKKIAGLPAGSTLQDSRTGTELNHMLFGDPRKAIAALYATHPPLPERIAALDPTFTAAELEQLIAQFAAAPPDGLAEDAAAGLVAGAPRRPPTPGLLRVEPQQVSASVGVMSPQTIARGRRIADAIPADIRQLASQPSTVVPLVLALLLDPTPEVAAAQRDALVQHLGAGMRDAAAELADPVGGLAPGLRLPLAGLAAPQLGARPQQERDAIMDALDALAAADHRILPFEYCLLRLVGAYLLDVSDPRRRSRPGRGAVGSATEAALILLAVVAAFGNADHGAAERAFTRAAAHLFPGRAVPYAAPPADPWSALDAAWPPLDVLASADKKVLVEALVIAVRDDGVVTVVEAELLRTACAVLHVPVPALLA
jgi:Zn-dependent protease with chaperone function